MAKKTVIQIVDDIDGAELDEYETVRWSLDGKSYEFDTSPEHAEEFRNHVATYVAASRSTGGRQAGRRQAATGRSANNTRAVRQWASENGYTVSDRGRIPADIVAAYEAAN
ncbi:Lsr2 family protein [Gordonia sp. (in: high G+C Gram-positive bacteria)]|uniref:histone-like nucleoid-structuring protein Lsr2 n=1 Tax=Gordonia sp. (in: high G+C Gram-positive bacteria) TaxID=84139 RepID=UPI0016B5AD88|nr:Lsr2 family protein [Gordonia sp. (in: high G+C Gram-positive bacteria)]NLG48250.1 Lsr2 family protein [Gordonia sp. (in: high G+C Gram-positive bacteria)]